MAGGYVIDPTTGMPSVRTASGALLPLPMGQDALTQAGFPPAPMPDMGPDMRVAGPGGGRVGPTYAPQPVVASPGGRHNPTAAEQAASQAAAAAKKQEQTATETAHLEQVAKAGGRAGASAALELSKRKAEAARTAPPQVATEKANPGELAMGPAGGDPQQQGQADDNGEGMIGEALDREYMAGGGGGGGGPRGLGVSGETRKMTTFERDMDPEAAAQAQQAQMAADQGAEDLAGRTALHQELAYREVQDEYARRAGQMQAMQERYEQQQQLLQDYQAKRDALEQEAAQMKTPQMDDYWKSKGTMATLLSGLSVALGGALQGLRGGSNPGMDMVNTEINRWIASQKEAYERAQGRVSAADNQYARMVQTFGSQNMAEAHMREQAYAVRDRMLQSMAEKVGTPTAIEAYQQAKLQGEAQRAALRAQATQGAQVEIEQKLSMQGGGGGGAPRTFRGMLKNRAEGLKDYRESVNGGRSNPARAIDSGKTDALAAALDTVQAADEVAGHVDAMGYGEDDTDDPRSGALDAVKNNIPGTQQRRRGQDLDQATFVLARGAQTFLGKSDNDALLAERQATGGGSGRERKQSAMRLKQKAVSKAKLELAAMTPDQRDAFMRALSPDQRAMVESMVNTDNRPATSEQAVKVRR